MKKLATIVLALGWISLPLAASASGGVWCDASDANLSFHFEASSARDGTGGWWGIGGRMEIKFGKLPKHLSTFDIRQENLTERWLGRDDVLLEVQKYDVEPFASVMLTVTTKSVEEASYKGSYELRISDIDGTEAYITRTGTVTCNAD